MAAYTAQVQSWLFAAEGGFVNHPSDPGGATNHGITRRTLAAWRGISPWRRLPIAEVEALSRAEAGKIMKTQYWDRVNADALPAGLDYAAFDYAVNSGVSKAGKDLQRTLGGAYTGTIDGIVGQLTLDAVRRSDIEALIRAYCERRYAFVRSLKTFAVFGRGWTRRIMGEHHGAQAGDIGVIDRAMMLARNAPAIPGPAEPAPGHAEPERDTVLDAIKKPEGLSMLLSAIGAVFSAIANQPLLQIAVVAGIGVAVFFFVRRMKRADPA